MNPRINFINYLRQLLPPHKRQTNRIAFLVSLAAPLQSLFDSFYMYRDDSRMMFNVNSQVMVLEGYLRKKYNDPIGIKVLTFDAGLLNIGLEIEGETMMVWCGLSDEGQLKGIPLKDELRDKFAEVDFIVYISAEIDRLRVEADIEKYKLALVTYKIIQQ